MEDSQTAAAVLEEPAPEREVIDGKRMVWRKLPLEKVQRVLSAASTIRIPTGPVIDPMILESRKKLTLILEFIRQRQEATREDLCTKGYVMGWVTDDEE
uniref:Uncharacterized protein n=1 Tax=Aegilops tauschii TaxID=37682 RepID=M8AM34_AEGTA